MRPSPLKVYAALLGVQVAFGSLTVAGKIAMRAVRPSELAFARALGAALLLVAIHVARGGRVRLPVADILKIAIFSVFGIAANQLLYLAGLERTSAINASLLITTIPVFSVLISLLLGRERLRPALALGLVTALAGVVYLIGPMNFRLGAETVRGDLLILANCFSYSIYLVLVRGVIRRHGPLTVMTFAFLFGAVLVLPFAARDLAHSIERPPTARALAVIAYVVLVPTVFAYVMNAWAIRHAPTSLVAVSIYVQPLCALGFAAIFLDERPNERILIAAALVFAGIGLVSLSSSSSKTGSRAAPPGASPVAE